MYFLLWLWPIGAMELYLESRQVLVSEQVLKGLSCFTQGGLWWVCLACFTKASGICLQVWHACKWQQSLITVCVYIYIYKYYKYWYWIMTRCAALGHFDVLWDWLRKLLDACKQQTVLRFWWTLCMCSGLWVIQMLHWLLTKKLVASSKCLDPGRLLLVLNAEGSLECSPRDSPGHEPNLHLRLPAYNRYTGLLLAEHRRWKCMYITTLNPVSASVWLNDLNVQFSCACVLAKPLSPEPPGNMIKS